MQEAWYWPAYAAGMAVAAWVDGRSRRVPNWVTGPLFAGALAAAWARDGADGLWDAAGGVLTVAAVLVLPFLSAGIALGPGDQKLALAAGAALGFQGALAFCALAGLGAAAFFGSVAWRQASGFRAFARAALAGLCLGRAGATEPDSAGAGPGIPFGPVLAAAALAAGAVRWLA